MNKIFENSLEYVNRKLKSNITIHHTDMIIYFNHLDINNGYLSQWYNSSFVEYNIIYPSVEHYLMYKKSILFNDKIATNLILENCMSTNPSSNIINMIGQHIKNYDEDTWNKNKINIMYHGNILKFSQNIDLKHRLLLTNNIILANETINDYITWDRLPSIYKLDEINEYNLLGFVLMVIRDRFINDIIKEYCIYK